ncbi:hypothetical protein HFO94_20535 [Rhizobium leguminosarum]|jgi:hypothetical protein|uniref:Uncharacterized protein n=1 Tax=Rhizobium laguerreae TaxID=1076926 RepID=A0A7Y2W3P9_9HYPH|nr:MULTISPECIES: hypothetical protein [Rhizobium]MBW8788157.1 hypothetical protein [Rhizobium leguminosarum]MBY5355881.1 hypothetical protein [Rhizobium leguminosarum]MBY5368513.1 hypothetical protein [Rhizobium leguminosarum]MBY5403018.1 hypothetical protein [Rhizobium leguminosarum]MBY5446385.1 hypothetical protein [Rhizobium leguminosarum]
MSSRLPPVPAENVSGKGVAGKRARTSADDAEMASSAENPDKKGQQGNSKINTTHQGNQQDR